jgi:transcriptional regulator with XRE-family HTH domain
MFSGPAIRTVRIFKRITQRDVAKKMGITQQAYSRMERKEWIKKEKIQEILTSLEVSMDEFQAIERTFHAKC